MPASVSVMSDASRYSIVAPESFFVGVTVTSATALATDRRVGRYLPDSKVGVSVRSVVPSLTDQIAQRRVRRGCGHTQIHRAGRIGRPVGAGHPPSCRS